MLSFEWGALRGRQPNLDLETAIVAADAFDPSGLPSPLQDASEAPRGQVSPSLFESLVVAADPTGHVMLSSFGIPAVCFRSPTQRAA
jgi:hypothetical protein